MSIVIVIFSHVLHKSLAGMSLVFPFNIFTDGGFGVNVFFVISGFLITRLLLEEEAQKGNISLKTFYIKRTFRIFPAYYFILFVYLILQLAGVLYFTTTSWLTSVFYLKYVGGGDWESGHFWSLSVEEHFYLFWPLVFKYFKKQRVSIAVLLILAVMFFRYNTYTRMIPVDLFMNQLSFFLRADALMVGCLTAVFYDKILAFFARVPIPGFTVLVVFFFISFLNSDILTNINYNHKLHLGAVLIPLGIGTSSGLLSNILIAGLIVYSIHYSKTVWFSFLNLPVMNYLGKLSYSLYLWQQIFFSEKVGFFSKWPFNIVFMLAAAIFSFHFIERPFLKLKDRINARRGIREFAV